MNENFALKLQNSLSFTSANQNVESRKRSSTFKPDESHPKRTKETSCVNIFTVPSTKVDEIEDDKILIIHIPPSQKKMKNSSSVKTENGKVFLC